VRGHRNRAPHQPDGGAPQRYALIVLSCDRRLDARAAARILGEPRVELASQDDLALLLGYLPTGVSPLWSNGCPVLLDVALDRWPTVLVGGGASGIEIELPPRMLLTNGVSLLQTKQ